MADKIQLDLKLNIEENVSKLTGKVKELSNTLKTLEKDFKNSTQGIDKYSNVTNVLTTKIDTAKNAERDLEDALKKSAKAVGENDEATKAMGKSTLTMSSNVNQATKAEKEHAKVAEAVGDEIERENDKLNRLASNISILSNAFGRLSAASFGALRSIIGTTVDLESAFIGVQKTMDEASVKAVYGADGWAKLRKELTKISAVTASTPEEIFAVAEAAGQLGISAEDITTFTKTMIELGDTTTMSAQDAAMQISRLGNILGITGKKYERLGSVIVDLGNNAAATESEITDVSTRIAATGKIVGMTAPEIAALGTAMVSVGVKSESGGTAMMNTLTQIEKAVASGGKKLDTFAKIAGKSSEEFAKKWNENATGALQDFLRGLKNAEDNGESAIVLLGEAEISSKRQQQTLLSMAQAVDKVDEYVTRANEAWKENTALGEEAEKRYGSLQTTMTQLDSSFTVLRQSLGESVSNPLSVIIQKIRDLVLALSEAPEPVKILADTLLVLTGVFSGLLSGVGMLASELFYTLQIMRDFTGKTEIGKNLFSSLTKSVKGFRVKLSGASTGFKSFLGFLKTPVGALGVTVGVTALIGAFSLLQGDTDKTKEKIENFVINVKEKFQQLAEKLPETMGKIAEVFPAVIDALVNGLPEIFKAGADILLTLARSFAENLPAITESAVKIITALVQKLIENLPEIIASGVALVGALAIGLVKSIPSVLNAVLSIAGAILSGLVSGLSGIAEIGKNIVVGLWNGISDKVSWLISMIKSFANKVKNTICSLFKINSPSKWAEDDVGQNIALGVGGGFVKAMPKVNKMMTNALTRTMDILSGSQALKKAINGTYEIAANAQNNISMGFDYDRLASAIGDRGIYLNGRLVGRELEKMGVAMV